jgi:hypothetical protein
LRRKGRQNGAASAEDSGGIKADIQSSGSHAVAASALFEGQVSDQSPRDIAAKADAWRKTRLCPGPGLDHKPPLGSWRRPLPGLTEHKEQDR